MLGYVDPADVIVVAVAMPEVLLVGGCVAKTISDETGIDVIVLLPVGTIEYGAKLVVGGVVVGWKLNAGEALEVSGTTGVLLAETDETD